jgi:hypothetical protein
MSQRFNLFSAGFCANAPALYYHQQDLAGQHGLLVHNSVSAAIGDILPALKQKEDVHLSQLRTALSIAREFEVDAPDLPANGEDYFDWFAAYVKAFEDSFPMSRIDHYYFLFGRKISEILVNLGLASSCLDLQLSLGNAVDLSRKTDKSIKDNEYILFKLIAPAALLSSEPRQNFFNVYYRSINGAFEPFRGLDVIALKEPEMRKLSSDLRAYGDEVLKGYRQCESQLKELGF